MASITIKYNNEIIGELNNLGSLIMKTAGHGCEYDIELYYINHCPRSDIASSIIMDSFFEEYEMNASAEIFVANERLTASETDYSYGYVNSGIWYYSASTTTNRVDIYQVEANKTYLIRLGSTVSNRFRVMFTTEDVTQATANVVGYNIYSIDNPSANVAALYTTTENGYIIIGKSNNSTNNIETFVYEGVFE
jgi:hypothetical protein